MSKVPQQLIDLLATRGIVPGATIRCCRSVNQITLPPYARWQKGGWANDLVYAIVDGRTAHLYDSDFDSDGSMKVKYATVITPAPQQPSQELDVLEEGMHVKCSDAMNEAIILRCEELGFPMVSTEDRGRHMGAGWTLTWGRNAPKFKGIFAPGGPELKAHEFLRRLENMKPKEQEIVIKGQPVTFSETGIYVDGVSVTKEQVLAVAERLEKPLMAGPHEVEFTKNGINVGCTSVDRDTVLAIAQRFKK